VKNIFLAFFIIVSTLAAATASSLKIENPKPKEPQLIIVDNDIYDPDWVILLSAALGMQRIGEAKIVAVLITGRDINQKQGMLYSSVMHYYGYKDIPIGLNHQQQMRTYSIHAARKNPPHKEYLGRDKNIDEFPSDGKLDTQYPDSSKLLCQLLAKSKQKVSWVVGGHLHHVANLLREKKACNGRALIKQKVKEIVLGMGWNSRTSGEPEINLSEGTTAPNDAQEATRYVFEHLPSSVPLIIATIPNNRAGESRVADIFKTKAYADSPMAFILSVPKYGIYGDHGLSDFEALLYAVRGTKSSKGEIYAKKVKSCFELTPWSAVRISKKKCKKQHSLFV
jgi:hypothetical protein